jgi:hypothetical protein
MATLKPTGLSRDNRTRYMRAYQAKRRGSISTKTLLEDSAVLTALAAGEITVACAAKVLGCDIVSVRERLDQTVAIGVERVKMSLEARMEALKKDLEKLGNGKAGA